MRIEDAVEGLIVTGPQGTGVLFRNENGWDVKLNGGDIRQSIDLSEWRIGKPDGGRKKLSED